MDWYRKDRVGSPLGMWSLDIESVVGCEVVNRRGIIDGRVDARAVELCLHSSSVGTGDRVLVIRMFATIRFGRRFDPRTLCEPLG